MIAPLDPQEPDKVGEEHGGRWIAWDDENLHIVASGATMLEVQQEAQSAGIREPTIEFVPPSDGSFVGGI
jgi:hypothetical protein